jgi:lipopolysaccharide export system protein LptA
VRWQQTARIVVAVVGLGCAAAILIYTRNRQQPPQPPTSLERIDPTAALEGSEGRTMLFKVGRSPINMKFGSTRTYDDGRMRWEKVEVKGLADTPFTILADVVETRGKVAREERPSHFDLTGHVVFITDDGLRLETDKASYEDATNQLTIPGPVTFTRGRMSGSGVGATYDRERDAIALLDQATARVAPDNTGHGGADASSTRMSLVRGQKTLRLEGNARVVGEAQTLTANEATFVFTDDERAVKYLELRGRARVEPNAGGGADRPAMSADNITMAFHQDGLTLQHATLTGNALLTIAGAVTRSIRASWIDFFTAPDGRTLTELHAKDRLAVELGPTSTAPGRTITATVLTATGNDKKGLTSARFEGNPKFEELPAAGAGRGGQAPPQPRWGTATTLVLALGGQLDAIERAEFQQKAEFHDGEITGWADLAVYNETKGTLELRPNDRDPRRPSRVRTADFEVNGQAIDVNTKSQDLEARGGVTTDMTRAADASSGKGALFAGDEPIIGGAEVLKYTKESGMAVYTGGRGTPAVLRQGATSVTGNQIEFVNSSRNLRANGVVNTTWVFEDTGTRPKAPTGEPKVAALKDYRVRAETLDYDEAKRTAHYTGPDVVLTTADGTIESRTLTFQLAAESRALESMRATRGKGDVVFVTLPGGREATADEVQYDAKTEVYTLRGKPAALKGPPNQDQGAGAAPPGQLNCVLDRSPVFEFNRRTGAIRAPGGGEAPRPTEKISCTASLRRAK